MKSKKIISKRREIVFFILIIASVFLLFGCMTAPKPDSALDNDEKIELLTSVSPPRMPGKMQYDIENESFPIGEASVKLSYGFWYDVSEADDVEYYEIRIHSEGFYSSDAEVLKTVEFNEGPYSKESFIYDKNSNGNLPLTETLALSEELFLEDRGFIRIVIYGITEDTEGELIELSPVVNVYYKKHGENLELSKEYFDFDTPLWIDEVGSKERESAIEECKDTYGIKEKSRYSIFKNYPIDCFGVNSQNVGEITSFDTVAIGMSAKDKTRIHIYHTSWFGQFDLEKVYTLKYNGDYSIAFGDPGYVYIYLWDDNTVISIAWQAESESFVQDVARIEDNPENEIIRKEIESENLSTKSFTKSAVRLKAEDGEYMGLLMEYYDGTEYVIHGNKAYAWEHFGDTIEYWLGSAIVAVIEFFGKIFGGN